MGNPRPKPMRLADKLLQIRKGLELSQTQMLLKMGLEETMHYGRISEYEQGKREPPAPGHEQVAAELAGKRERLAGHHRPEYSARLPEEEPGFDWWTARGSNPRPPHCERGALPTELAAHETRKALPEKALKERKS